VVLGKKYYVLQNSHGYKATGIASWYGMKFHGFRTSSGEPYDMYAMTAAHKTLPLPCYVRVTNLDNSKSIIVKVTDRGPFPPNRLIDLSYVAAARLDIIRKGTARVRVEAINPKDYKSKFTKYQQPANPKIKPQIYDSGQYLQVAAFRQKDNAEKLVEKIKTLSTHPVFIRQDTNSNIYKVQIGPLDAKNTENLTSKLSGLDLNPHLVSLK
jgi:rare lipoprotein A